MKKGVLHILKGREKNIGVETVLQPLPHKEFRFANPFIVLHHLLPQYFYAGSTENRIPPHPHKGFAPVTFLFQGEGFHKDSRGNNGKIKAGDVQWMFAGKGLLHSEGPTKDFLEKGGNYEFVQLWVNVPKAHKLDDGFYQQARKEEMPQIFDQEDGIELRLASGNYGNLTGPLRSFTPVISIFGTAVEGKTFQLSAQEGYWTLLYVLEGKILINDENEVEEHHLVIFNKTGTDIKITTLKNSKLLYLSAEPIDEPVAAKGNFVMNTPEEIEQAEKEYAEGKFGKLDY